MHIENKKSIHMAMDEIAEDVLTLAINDFVSAQNSHNLVVENVPMEGNLMLYSIFLFSFLFLYSLLKYVTLFIFLFYSWIG